jgi:hypothetical protein
MMLSRIAEGAASTAASQVLLEYPQAFLLPAFIALESTQECTLLMMLSNCLPSWQYERNRE